MAEVQSLFGDPIPLGEPVESCVEALEAALERAKAGETVGVVIAEAHADRASSYRVAGLLGGYGTLGAVERAKADLMVFMQELDADG